MLNYETEDLSIIMQRANTLSRTLETTSISINEDETLVGEVLISTKETSLKNYINIMKDREIDKAVENEILHFNYTEEGYGHIIIDYEDILSNGINSHMKKYQKKCNENPENDYYRAALISLSGLQKYIIRYANLAFEMSYKEKDENRKRELSKISEIARKVSYCKPDCFRDALQLFWFINITLLIENNGSCISCGRFDQYMFDFYKKALAEGTSESSIKQLILELFTKMNFSKSSFNLTLGGVNPKGRNSFNPLSHLIIECKEYLATPQPELSIRISEKTDVGFTEQLYLKTIKDSFSYNVYNDDAVIPTLLSKGITLYDARNYALIDEGELTIPGKAYSLNSVCTLDMFSILELIIKEKDIKNLSFEALTLEIKNKLKKYLKLCIFGSNIVDIGHEKLMPLPLTSCFFIDCLDKGASLSSGGAKYNFSGIQLLRATELCNYLFKTYKKEDYFLADLVDYCCEIINPIKSNRNGQFNLGLTINESCESAEEMLKELSIIDSFTLANGNILNLKANEINDVFNNLVRLKIHHLKIIL